MCGRFTLKSTPEAIAREYEVQKVPLLKPRFNIAPTQEIPAVGRRPSDGDRILHFLRWGLIPYWAKDPTSSWILARRESVAAKPAFRDSFRRRRCLLPADGFYEWKNTPDGRQPFHIRLAGAALFTFAGIWDRWRAPDGTTVISCALLTRAADGPLASLHDRMPVVLEPSAYGRWLASDLDDAELEELAEGLPGDRFEFFPVSKRVNDVRNEGPELTAPIDRLDE